MHAITLLLLSDGTLRRVSAVTGKGSPDEIPTFWQSKVRTRCQAVFGNEQSLRL
jgi:hypothetical protein